MPKEYLCEAIMANLPPPEKRAVIESIPDRRLRCGAGVAANLVHAGIAKEDGGWNVRFTKMGEVLHAFARRIR